jgi:hypothetical protein
MASDYVGCSYVRWIRWYNVGLVTNGLGYGERMRQSISVSTQDVCYLLWMPGKKTPGMHGVERVRVLERGHCGVWVRYCGVFIESMKAFHCPRGVEGGDRVHARDQL